MGWGVGVKVEQARLVGECARGEVRGRCGDRDLEVPAMVATAK